MAHNENNNPLHVRWFWQSLSKNLLVEVHHELRLFQEPPAYEQAHSYTDEKTHCLPPLSAEYDEHPGSNSYDSKDHVQDRMPYCEYGTDPRHYQPKGQQ